MPACGTAAHCALAAQNTLTASSFHLRGDGRRWLQDVAGQKFKRVTMLPRYPLLGGWQTDIVLGYSLPLQNAALVQNGERTLVYLVPPMIDLVRLSSCLDGML